MEDVHGGVGITTRDEIWTQQIDRLPSLARRLMLHPRPEKALRQATMQDALEMAAADVVESGRAFAEVDNDERQEILTRYFDHCLQRNLGYLKDAESQDVRIN